MKFWFFHNKVLSNIYNMYFNAITELELWDYLKVHTIKSYITHQDDRFKQLYKRITELSLPNTYTYNFIMKQMNQIAQVGYDIWEYTFIEKHFPEYITSAKLICNQCYDILSSPYYSWGRKRIMKNYDEAIKSQSTCVSN